MNLQNLIPVLMDAQIGVCNQKDVSGSCGRCKYSTSQFQTSYTLAYCELFREMIPKEYDDDGQSSIPRLEICKQIFNEN